MNYKDMKIIKIIHKLFVNNVAQFTAHLTNDYHIICKQCGMFHSQYRNI